MERGDIRGCFCQSKVWRRYSGATDRGFYQLVREEETGGEVPVMLLGFNGSSEESNLTLQQIDELRTLVAGGRVRWLDAGEAISLEGETYLAAAPGDG